MGIIYRIFAVGSMCLLLASRCPSATLQPDSGKKFIGFAPDEQTGLLVGEAFIRGVFGQKRAALFQTFTVTTQMGRWIVTAHRSASGNRTEGPGNFTLVVDPHTSRAVAFGTFARSGELDAVLRRIPPDATTTLKGRMNCYFDLTALGGVGKFRGVLPDASSAEDAARPLYVCHFDKYYLKLYEPLRARKLDGWWYVNGESAAIWSNPNSPDYGTSLEPYKFLIDPISGRPAGLGVYPQPGSLEESLRYLAPSKVIPSLWKPARRRRSTKK